MPVSFSKKPILVLAVFVGIALAWAGPARAMAPLVSAAWLAQNHALPNIRVLDLRGDTNLFARGHVPGAALTDYGKHGWRTTRGRVPGMMPQPAMLERLIGGLGISNRNHVILVARGASAGEMGIATRVYWTFKVLGHDAVSILDGGMAAYVIAGHPLSRNAQTPKPTIFQANLRPELIATEEDVRDALDNGTTRLIDHRPNAQFFGMDKSRSTKRAGALPGATNAPGLFMTQNGQGFFQSPEALQNLYTMAGAETVGPVINYCNTGHWASLGWFASYALLGNTQARMYDGSMAEWTLNPLNPVSVIQGR